MTPQQQKKMEEKYSEYGVGLDKFTFYRGYRNAMSSEEVKGLVKALKFYADFYTDPTTLKFVGLSEQMKQAEHAMTREMAFTMDGGSEAHSALNKFYGREEGK